MCVVDREPSPFVGVNDGRVEGRFRQGIERVDPVIPGSAGSKSLRQVELMDLVSRELPKPVICLRYVLVAIHLEDVAKALVDKKATHRKARRIRDGLDEIRVAAQYELVHRCADRELVHFLLLVECKRIVHIESKPGNAMELEVSIAKDAVASSNSRPRGWWEVLVKGQEELLRR